LLQVRKWAEAPDVEHGAIADLLVAHSVLVGMGLVAGPVCAENYSFEFSNEVKQGEQRPGFTNKVMVRRPRLL
jgi:hypothetical protein